jgi:DNA-binding winged helix-turn-helix (wHTH) protein/tetratricopeptide (TPR) repeat protein
MPDSDMCSNSVTQGFRFGDFELRSATHELLCNNQRIDLQPRVFDLIEYLLLHRDRVISKDELQQALWSGRIVTEAALTRAVMKARRALDEAAGQADIIKTEHSRGYRFVGEVIEFSGSPRTEGLSSEAAGGYLPLARRHWPLAGGLGILFVLMVMVLWLWRSDVSQTLVQGDAPIRVAVLPVSSADDEPSSEWLSLGLMSAIAQILSEGANLATVPAQDVLDVFPVGKSSELIDEADARLRLQHRATHVISATLHRHQGNYRLAYRLSGSDGRQRRRSVVGIDVQSLSRAVGADLLALFGTEMRRMDDLDDFTSETYLRGRALQLQGEIEAADEQFRIAVERTPDAFWPRYQYALTRRDLGDREKAEAILNNLLAQTRGSVDAGRWRAAANSLALSRMEAGALGEAETLLDEALEAGRRAGDVDAIGTVLTNRSIVQRRLGRLDAAMQEAEAALAAYRDGGVVYPPGEIHNTIAQAALAKGDLALAQSNLESAIEAFRLVGDRRYEAVSLNSLSRLHRRKGELVRANELARKALALHEATGERRLVLSILVNLSHIAEAQGQLESAETHAREALELAQQLAELPRLGYAHRRLGEVMMMREQFDQAEHFLDEADRAFAATDEFSNQQHVALIRASLDRRTGRFAMARDRLDSVLAWTLDTGNAGLHRAARIERVELHLLEGQPDDALLLCEHLLENSPESPMLRERAEAPIHLLRARAFLLQDDPVQAQSALNLATGLEQSESYERILSELSAALPSH